MDRSEVKFAIAKYMPCFERQEPRNIGVMAWRNGKAVCRFFDKKPKFVGEKKIYDQWISYWNKLAAGEQKAHMRLEPKGRMHDFTVSDEQFIDAVCRDPDPFKKYFFARGGSLWPNEGTTRDLAKIADAVFAELVA